MSESEITSVPTGSGDLVVVGSSAGGVEALSTLIGTLPVDFPAPIVLAQHLDPNRPSALDMILQRRTHLSVVLVHSHTSLEPGKVYVVPSNYHATIRDGYVELQGDHDKRPRPSVDMLLSSAARAYGDRLIAVILTGSGSDGAAGAVDVKNAGGTVIVQDPKTARYPSMPLALPPTIIDFEANIEQIGPLIYDLLAGVNLPQQEEITQSVLQGILEQVSRQASIDFRPYKTSTILRRIGRRMTATHNRSISDYAHYIEKRPSEIGELVKAFLINVTQFFRDPDAFALLKKDILPNLVTEARARDRVLRFWSAGCATGEEPYSLAMLLVDLLDTELADWSIKIFATDVDEEAITFARRGLYSENMPKSVPVEYQKRFFERVDHGYRIAKSLRQMVIFGQQDLSRSAPFPRIDMVLCRNVLIYFMPELQNYVLSQFAFSLNTNGCLFLGKAETVRPNQAYYELVNKRWKIYRCTGSALPMLPQQNLSNLPVARLLEAGNRSDRGMGSRGQIYRAQSSQASASTQAQTSLPELLQLRHFNELLLRFLPVGIVVIDRAYRIVTANGEARRLLGLRDTGTEQDFLHSVRGIPYPTVRETIDLVFRERKTVTLPEVELENTVGGNGRFISFSIALMQMDGGIPDLATISVSDVTEQIQIRRQLETVQAEQAQLMNELGTANRRLNDINKELLDANEELQVTNEELLLTHEELQATIEEFETTNEELQATNEELETSNEELQATNEELETTNDELRASTAELQELTGALENERVRLTEIVELAPFHILVLRGPNLLIEAFNPSYAPLLEAPKAPEGILGQPLEEIYEYFWAAGIEGVRLAREAYQQDAVRATARIRTYLPQTNGIPVESYFVYTMVPSHDTTGKVSGVIIYAVDETIQRAREIIEEREKLKLLFDNADMSALALYDAQTSELIIGSERYLDTLARAHEIDRNTLVGRTWDEMAFVTPYEQAIAAWKQVIKSGAPLRVPEVRWEFPQQGKETIWDCSLIPLMDRDRPESRYFILVSAVEITDQAQARQEVERLNYLKDEFLSLASHELRTPLTSILGNAELLQLIQQKQEARVGAGQEQAQEGTPKRESEALIVGRIVHQAVRMGWLVDEMLDITRMRGEVFELNIKGTVDVVAVARRVVEQFETTTRRAITLETNQESISGDFDEERLEQVLNNLVSNALKYSLPTTPVVVSIELRPAEHDRPGEVIIRVQDEGVGIDEEDQARIFDRFYRVHSNKHNSAGGLGLGLYIAYEIIERQGGRMWLESRPGVGSTFYVSLPLTT
ncbi:MAG TPA: CheR family methyltransferase [Ktedonobacteraceae bacterium]|nr:CheR family methyltransferase [Ktedonobacteraceae bacterium]